MSKISLTGYEEGAVLALVQAGFVSLVELVNTGRRTIDITDYDEERLRALRDLQSAGSYVLSAEDRNAVLSNMKIVGRRHMGRVAAEMLMHVQDTDGQTFMQRFRARYPETEKSYTFRMTIRGNDILIEPTATDKQGQEQTVTVN